MMNYVWTGMMLISVIFGIFTGRLDQVSAAVVDGGKNAVMMTVEFVGIMCFWTGLVRIASRSGFILMISNLLMPITKLCFPNLPRNSAAMHSIVMNMTANILGLANAATPLGLNAMRELQKVNNNPKDTASDDMCMFVVLNTASIQLIPTTLIVLRRATGSIAPFEILTPVWIVGSCALIVGIICAKIFCSRSPVTYKYGAKILNTRSKA
ncbi:MAG: nucleoside recognition domain-containing protein [Eubacteriales bacterium]|nr:nucleoside recognition domain-containing protein [Eubacteriales bacterium]